MRVPKKRGRPKWRWGRHAGDLQSYQDLFQRLADDYAGTVVCTKMSDEGCALDFFDGGNALMSSCFLEIVDFMDSSRDGIRLVAVHCKEGGLNVTVHVSQLTSAVLAVCVR